MNERTQPFKAGGHEEVYPGLGHDPYALRGKLPEPTVCRQCGAVYAGGRWQWTKRPEAAHETLCSACHREADGLPAGYVHIGGAFAAEHRDELLQLVRHHGERARNERPMQRIFSMEEDGGGMIVTTSDVHLARDIGSALKSAYQGTLDLKYNPGEHLVRVHWSR